MIGLGWRELIELERRRAPELSSILDAAMAAERRRRRQLAGSIGLIVASWSGMLIWWWTR